MQVPEHIVSLYIATCGQNGSGLGSDEKEIILLVYVVIDASTAQILGVKQILVRPIGNFDGKDRTISTSSETCSSITGSSSPPPSTLSLTLPVSHNSTTIIATQQNTTGTTTGITATTNATTTATANSPLLGEIPIININAQTANATQSIINSFNGPPTIAELPISIAQAAGKPLNEAIDEFDDYIRSLTLGMGFKLITDGQLPLRQCMHPEACAKDIELPTYYCKFSDLRKEYVKYKSGSDLSRALVPMKDVKKILQMPTMPVPQSIAEMAKELNILYDEDDSEFYIKESRDMVSVIQAMLKGGHQFYESEIINLTLEPGICSIDDEIDGGCIVRARGLPWQSSDQDIAKFFRGLNVAKGGVALCLSQLGRRNGEALVRFESQEHRDMALKRHKHHIGNRYIEVYRATGDDFLAIAGGASNEAQAFLSKGAQVIIRMRGLPYDCTAKQVLDFFTTGENPCDVLDGSDGVLFVKKPDGRATGDAFVLFALESDLTKALSRHRESIGQRYIELFRSTTAEVQQVLNRSMDPKTYEAIHQPPLIAQLPSVPLSLLPQHLITSGTTKNCIRLRGLPYEALVEHILQFLEDFAKNIIYQGVHMVINAQGQPSGEAFIQMDSEESARQCAQSRHNHLMIFRKKRRYIEVFQCSGDDMNMVLSGGLQSPIGTHGLNHHHHAANKQTSLISPGAGSLIGTPFGAFGPHFGPTAALIPSTHRGHHPGFYAQPLVYWPYPSPPVSPTTYYGSSHSTTHIAATQHQSLFPVEFLTTSGSAVSPTAYQQSQTSPTALTPIHIQTAATSSLVSASQGAALKMTITPKQFHALASPHPTAATTALPNSMAVTNGGGHSLHYHHRHKLPLQLSPTPLSGGGGNGTCSSVYHQYPSPPPLLSQSQQHLLTVDTATTQLYHPTGAKSLIPTPYAVFSNSNNNSNNVNSNAIAISSSSSSSLSSLSSPPVQQGTISPTTSTAAAAAVAVAAGTTSAIKPNQFVELYIT